jgi:deoxyhypusine synthase
MEMTGNDHDHRSSDIEDLATTMGMEGRSVYQLARDMAKLGFQAGQLGRSVEAWQRMLAEEEITIFLGLAGAMVPAGLRKLISFMITERLVDCVVSTGANLFHDLCEGLGVVHYRGDPLADDAALREEGIDRIFDVYVSEAGLQKGDRYVAEFVKTLDPGRVYSSRELMEMLGRKMPATTLLGSASRAGVPIFVPALSDSSIGIGMVLAWREGHRIVVDQIKDVDEISQITEKSSQTGVVFVGGGVPKNFIQQTKVVADLCGRYRGGHNYAIQYTIDSPHFGGLSGCTFSEGVSWGKIAKEARMIQVFVDATIALPIVVHALDESGTRRKTPPRYVWKEGELSLAYEERR